MNNAGVQPSQSSIAMTESLRMFANTAPSIMQVSSEESSHISESATQAKTAASIRQRRFALDLKKRITNASTAPITPPVSRERPISRSGSSTIA